MEEELYHILGDNQYCLLYGSKHPVPDEEDIKIITENYYKQKYGKGDFKK